MINLKVLDTLTEEITEIDEGSTFYPYSKETKLTLKNEGTYKARNVTVSISKGVTVQNYSSPAMIAEAKIEAPGYQFAVEYFDLTTPFNNTITDLANFPLLQKEAVIDQDGYCRNIISGMAISFNHLLQYHNSGIYISEAYYMCGVALDVNGVAGDYTNMVKFPEIEVNEEVSFWYRFFLRRDMQGQRNPRVFNLVIKGEEDK